jgi:hypothetical protein
MRTSVSGNSFIVTKAEELYPNYIKKLVKADGTENTLLRDLLVEMGLRVELGNVVYEKDYGPYSKVEFDSPELEDADLDLDIDVFSYIR